MPKTTNEASDVLIRRANYLGRIGLFGFFAGLVLLGIGCYLLERRVAWGRIAFSSGFLLLIASPIVVVSSIIIRDILIPKRFRFTIRDLLIGITAIALILGILTALIRNAPSKISLNTRETSNKDIGLF
jgi:low affinity Fe/Cu permease